MKSNLFALAVIALIVFSGCVQQVTESLNACLAKCPGVCDALKANNASLDGYQVSLTKSDGQTSVTCGCACQS